MASRFKRKYELMMPNKRWIQFSADWKSARTLLFALQFYHSGEEIAIIARNAQRKRCRFDGEADTYECRDFIDSLFSEYES